MKVKTAIRLFTFLSVIGMTRLLMAGPGNGCSICSGRACYPRERTQGACACEIVNNLCRAYGKCVRGKCVNGSASQDVIRVKPSQHPWLTSRMLVDDIRVYSPELAEVLAAEHADIANKVGWYYECRNQVGGTAGVNAEIEYRVTRDGTKWTFEVLPVKPTLAERLDEKPDLSAAQTLEVDGTTWTIKQGEQVRAQGAIR